MIGAKLYIGKFSEEQYSAAADWCNKNLAAIVDTHAFDEQEPYYEIVPISALFSAVDEGGDGEDVNG